MTHRGRGCVVVGAGLAAATVVQTLHDEGFNDPITLIGEENVRPYERPALSKDYLQVRKVAADLHIHPNGWYAEHQVQTRFGEAVVRIDRDRSEVVLRSGDAVAYQHLVLATGASPRSLNLPGGATWPTPTTRPWVGDYASSTGTTPAGKDSSPPGSSLAGPTGTTGSPTSTPTSTTSAWSTSGASGPTSSFQAQYPKSLDPYRREVHNH